MLLSSVAGLKSPGKHIGTNTLQSLIHAGVTLSEVNIASLQEDCKVLCSSLRELSTHGRNLCKVLPSQVHLKQ